MMRAEQRGVGEDGLWIADAPAASAATVEPVGIATGKFHGGVMSTTESGANSAPSTCSRSWARCA